MFESWHSHQGRALFEKEDLLFKKHYCFQNVSVPGFPATWRFHWDPLYLLPGTNVHYSIIYSIIRIHWYNLGFKMTLFHVKDWIMRADARAWESVWHLVSMGHILAVISLPLFPLIQTDTAVRQCKHWPKATASLYPSLRPLKCSRREASNSFPYFHDKSQRTRKTLTKQNVFYRKKDAWFFTWFQKQSFT